MPSDPRVAQALSALAQPIAEFRALVQGALTQADAYLAAQDMDPQRRAARAAAELGAFAAGRIDASRFAGISRDATRPDPVGLLALRRATETLRAVRALGDGLFVVEVTPGARLGAIVNRALAEAGRAFGALVISELVRGGGYRVHEHDILLDRFEFGAWNTAERRFAPPLIVVLEGVALHASDLTDFTDGRAKLVLVVHGACAPAPLARCITPGALVLQTSDGSGLDRVAAFEGPAIAAMVPEGAATFLHDPAAGREPWQRLTIRHLPEAPKHAVGGMSTWQMREDLRLLADLARTPFAVPSPNGGKAVAATGAADAAERIAGWLLDNAGLTDAS
jgi:hypothetical protein